MEMRKLILSWIEGRLSYAYVYEIGSNEEHLEVLFWIDKHMRRKQLSGTGFAEAMLRP